MLGFAQGSCRCLHLAELAPVEVTEAAVLTLVRKGVGAPPVPPSSLASDALLAVGWGSDPPFLCCPVRQQDCWYFLESQYYISVFQYCVYSSDPPFLFCHGRRQHCWYFSITFIVQIHRPSLCSLSDSNIVSISALLLQSVSDRNIVSISVLLLQFRSTFYSSDPLSLYCPVRQQQC